MKKVILLFMVSLFGMAAMAQSKVYIYKPDGSVLTSTIATVDSISFTPPGVLINGVRWASRNVAAPGTFATNPEDAGCFYQWNNKEGWPATGALGSIIATNGTTTFDQSWNGGFTTASESDTWSTARDPSPAGYRVPTQAEILTLLDDSKVTATGTTQNGVSGYKFTDIATGNSIFLPASGLRGTTNPSYVGSHGRYWSSTASSTSTAYSLGFDRSTAGCVPDVTRANSQSIRPVAE